MKKTNFIIALFTLFMFRVIAQPTVAATTPTKAAADVISVFSDAYTNVSRTDFNPDWGQGTLVSNITVSGNNVLKYQNMDFQGTQLGAAINASSMEKLHVDIWTANGVNFDFYLVNPANGAENFYRLTPSQSGWVSYDIPLITNFNRGVLNNIGQFKFIDPQASFRSSTTTYYLDNIYFWKSAIVLPIELTSFTANTEGSKTNLTWATASEINNQGFDIERSYDGVNFTAIGNVKGIGKAANYNFVDANPYDGINYYRLKQMDFDGKETRSKVISVQSKGNGTSKIKIFPSHTEGVVLITNYELGIRNDASDMNMVSVYNHVGQLVLTNKGVNRLDLSALPSGMYLVQVKAGGETVTEKVFKR